ncbi:O-antigen ligase family protein [Microvirga lotononidis]|uniref:Lipid A core-O-antigen ligase-like enyme n=1 Tax=Microvirga lotononidis TaxID=864069 RepID=I4YVZ2_9HYPH|nr:O-antigen ligase family protein [Microvirga lotononidis]EIM28134.1 lipid A core-O-antigen ligase-like enyme [Microvirga lotononidis]WQO27761.1 O-antigen ligase family protein [Microvirga lotononidis]
MIADAKGDHEQDHVGDPQKTVSVDDISPRSVAGRQKRLGVHLDNIGHGFIVLLPIAMVVANRSSPLLLACAAFFVLASRLASGAIGSDRSPFKNVRPGVLLLVLCGIAYPLISLSWAIGPAVGLFSWGEAVLPAVSSAALIMSWRAAPPPQWMAKALAWTMLIAAGLIAVELLLKFPLRRFLPERIGGFIHNRPVVTILLLLAPVLVLVDFRSHRMLCSALLLIGIGTIFVSDSEAAKLGSLVAVGTFALSYAPFIWVKRFLTVVLLGLIWMQPFFGSAMRNLPESVVEATKAGHSRERIALWQAFSDVTHHFPVLGTGFSSSPHMARHPVAAQIDPAYRPMLRVGHPHNAFLQVWVELGAVGALLLSALVLWVLRCLSGAPEDVRRVGLMTLMTASAIALVSHGAWQGWWIAAVTLAAALLTIRPVQPKPME